MNNNNKFCKAVGCRYSNFFGLKIKNGCYSCRSQAVPNCDYLDISGNIRNYKESCRSLKSLCAWLKYIKK